MDDDSLSVLGQGITPVKLTLQGDCKGQVQGGALVAVSKKRHFFKDKCLPLFGVCIRPHLHAIFVRPNAWISLHI